MRMWVLFCLFEFEKRCFVWAVDGVFIFTLVLCWFVLGLYPFV